MAELPDLVCHARFEGREELERRLVVADDRLKTAYACLQHLHVFGWPNAVVGKAMVRDALTRMNAVALDAAAAATQTVPHGHCMRCARCGWTLHQYPKDGCILGNCCARPLPEFRATCAGCGAPFEAQASKTEAP